jgi:hypothetical protein
MPAVVAINKVVKNPGSALRYRDFLWLKRPEALFDATGYNSVFASAKGIGA